MEVSAISEEKKEKCAICGVLLGPNNGMNWEENATAFHPICLNCQEKGLKKLEKMFGRSMALFYSCLRYDVPFEIRAAAQGSSKTPWREYLETLRTKKLDKKNGKQAKFEDGMTEIDKIFGADLEKGEMTQAIHAEKTARNTQQGTKEQRKVWGIGNERNPYTTEDYKELDRLFQIFSARLESAGGYDTQQEHILRLCARMHLDMQRFLDVGAIEKAQKLNRMIQENLASENLRKKDEKPVEEVRIDSIVDALEKAGMMKEGKILDLPQLTEVLLKRLTDLGGKPSHKYPYTLDAADQMIHIILNTMRRNDDLPEIEGYPDNTRLDENVAAEFSAKPNEEEEKVYDALGLKRMGKKEAAEDAH